MRHLFSESNKVLTRLEKKFPAELLDELLTDEYKIAEPDLEIGEVTYCLYKIVERCHSEYFQWWKPIWSDRELCRVEKVTYSVKHEKREEIDIRSVKHPIAWCFKDPLRVA